MANRVILSRKEQFVREIAAYRGDDPLKLRYEFLLWLDSNFGKDKVIDIFTSTLEEALNTHWNDARYKEDSRLIELQMIYATLQPNPLNVYQSYYDRGVAQQSSVLYVNWANHLAASGDFAGADKIYKMGSEKTSSAQKAELNKAFEKFLAVVGRKFLDGEMATEKLPNCPKCQVQLSAAPAPAPAAEDVKAIEMNPGKAGCWEDFQTAVMYFDDHDVKSIRMYPKDKVYKDAGKEYSLEEIKATEYFEKLKKKEQLQVQKLKEKPNKMPIMSFDPPCEADPVMKDGAFPTPLLPCSGKEDSISAQSFTTRTKLAMHLVQDMWSSPTPEVQPPILSKNEENKPKSAFPIYMDENPETPKAAEKKPPAPFQVFADSPDEGGKNNKNPVSLAKKSTAKKNGLQTKSNVLSERKLKNGEVGEEPKAAVKQQLHFENDDDNEMLAKKLSGTTVSDPHTPFQPFGGFKPLFPVEQGKDDFSDITCNTKAFNFALPSSTPVQQRKSLAPYHSTHQDSKSNASHDERPSCHTQQNLSVILEASKERCSSSGSSTGSSQPRTPAFPAKTLLKAIQNCRRDLSYSTNGPGTASANRSFTWLANPHKLNSNIISIAKPNCSQNNEEFDTPSTCTPSYLKFRPSSGKLAALNSIKENYFHDRSGTRSFKSSLNCNISGNRSPIDSVPRASGRNSGAMLLELVRAYTFKNEFNVPKKTDTLSYSHHRLQDTSESIFGDTINGQESKIGSDSVKKPCDHIRSVFCESTNTHLVQPLPYSELVDNKRDPKIEKFERKGYLLKKNRLSGGLPVSKPVKSKQKPSDANLKNKAKQKSYPSKQNLKLNRPENLSFCTIPPSFDTTNEPIISSVKSDIVVKYHHRDPRIKNQAKRKSGLRSSSPSCSVKPVPIYHLRNPGMKTQRKRKSGLRPSNRSSGKFCDPSMSVIGIRGSTIPLSPTNAVNEPLQSVILQPAKRKCGLPKNKSVSVRKSSVDMAGEESPFKLCNIRKNPDILIGCKRKHSTEFIDDGRDKVFKSRMKHRRNSCRIKSNSIGNRNKYMTRSKSTPSFTKSNMDDVPKQLIVEDCNDIDPFCPLMNEKLLTLLNFPQPHHVDGYQLVNTNLPTVSKNIRLGSEAFTTYGDLGKGAYARVVRASSENSNVALKIEKPPCKWEFYIAKEIQRRVDPKTRPGFMDIKTAYIFSNGSVLVTEWAKHGSLLNIINLYKQHTGKVLEPVLSLHFAIEVTRAVEYLHKCKIIHGDIKPDNFVVRSLPTVNETEPCLMLIDFGRSIDMSLFPEGTKFSRVVTTEGFQCNEMKEQRSWTYQTDLYGLAGTIHCLLLGEYMKVTKKNDEWKLHKGLPRNMKRELWDPIFHQLLNVPSCDQLPNLTEIRKTLEGAFADYNPYVKVQYFNHISNIVMGK